MDSLKPGWYPDPDMPGAQRYFDGEDFTDHVAPIPPSMSVWKGIRIVGLGILAALAVVWIVVQLSQPSDLDCSLQRVDYVTGEIGYYDVDEACRDGLNP